MCTSSESSVTSQSAQAKEGQEELLGIKGTDLGVEVSHLKVNIFAALCIMRNCGAFLLYNFVHFISLHADSSFQFVSPFRCKFCLLIIHTFLGKVESHSSLTSELLVCAL